MNKYQDAFEYVLVATNGGEGMVAQLKTLEKLVEKETPKKPFFANGCKCKNCSSNVDYGYPRCPHCGQALDWSDDNE